MNLDIETIQEEGCHIIVLCGYLDASNSLMLDEVIQRKKDKHINKLLIDCGNLLYISSAGLGVFLSHLDYFNSDKAKFILFSLSEKLLGVFRSLGIDELLNIVNTKEEAIHFATRQEQPAPPKLP
jgi:anti-sigma B factor antagonist